MLNLDERYRGCLAHLRFPEELSRGRRSGKKAGKYCFIEDVPVVGNCDSLFRLHGTTQVFVTGEIATANDRLLHAMEVTSVAKYIAWFVGLNEHLTEAIALGHDTGYRLPDPSACRK